MASFSTQLEEKVLTIKIEGDITGEQDYPGLQEGAQSLLIDLDKLGYINSSGIKSWINWKKAVLDDHKIGIEFCNIPRCFVEQINMLSDMVPAHAKIRSFKVPYYVEDTDDIHEVLMVKTIDFHGDQVKCEEFREIDGNEAEIDVDMESYFKFLKDYA